MNNLNHGKFINRLAGASRKFFATRLRKLTSSSFRSRVRKYSAWATELLDKTFLWHWEIARFPRPCDRPYEIIYIGRRKRRDYAKALLGIDPTVDEFYESKTPRQKIYVSEIPFPGALKVPRVLRTVIPLGRTLNEVTSGFDRKLRQVLRNQREDYRTQLAQNETEIRHADQNLLQPYANARHGEAASQFSSREISRIAQGVGRLDLVISGDEVVGCILGCEITHAGKRSWELIRCGYPEVVFSDSKRLREINAINFYLALEWAIQNGFDYFDMGTCMARPENGLLQWKKRWGGLVDTLSEKGWFYIRLPGKRSAQFLWDTPLFAIEDGHLALHLGLPDGQNDEAFSLRFRDMNRGMGIGGLFKIHLHHTSPPSENLLATLRSHYAHLKSPPIVECIPSN